MEYLKGWNGEQFPSFSAPKQLRNFNTQKRFLDVFHPSENMAKQRNRITEKAGGLGADRNIKILVLFQITKSFTSNLNAINFSTVLLVKNLFSK